MQCVRVGEQKDREMAQAFTKSKADFLIAQHIDPYPDPVKQGHGWYRLKERGVPIYAIIGALSPAFDNLDDVADAFGVSREAVDAAIAYYRRHQAAIDARLAANHVA